MPPESEKYFAELAEQIGRIQERVECIPEIEKKVERVRIFIEGVDGDNGMKKAVTQMQVDVAEIKTYRSNEQAVRDSRAPLRNRIITLLFYVIGVVIGGVALGVTMFFVMQALQRS